MKIPYLLFLSLLFFGSCNIFESKKDRADKVRDDEVTDETPAAHDPALTNEGQRMAEFEGGSEGLMRYLQRNIKYPSFCSESSIQGKVYIESVIDPDGYVTNTKVKRSVHPDLDNEALRVVKSMPRWIPATDLNGNPVQMRYVLPVNFKLE